MRYKVEEIEQWAHDGSVTSPAVTLELCHEIKKLREELEKHNAIMARITEESQKGLQEIRDLALGKPSHPMNK